MDSVVVGGGNFVLRTHDTHIIMVKDSVVSHFLVFPARRHPSHA
jgi:hypothetical protein